MKTVRILAAMFVAVLSLGFVACSDDDDDDKKGGSAKVNFEELVFSDYTTVKKKLGTPSVEDFDEGYGMYMFGDENKQVSTAMFLFEGEEQVIYAMTLSLKPEVKESSVLNYLDKKYSKIDLGDVIMYSDTEDWLEANLLVTYSKDDILGITLMYMNQTTGALAKSRTSVEDIKTMVKANMNF